MTLIDEDIVRIRFAKDLIDSDITRHHTISDIALYAGISAAKLKRVFNELYGTGLYHYLKEKRLERGKYLLENTSKTLKEICPVIGYEYVSNFIIAFKKEFGCSPGAWRKRITIIITIVRYLPELFLEKQILIF